MKKKKFTNEIDHEGIGLFKEIEIEKIKKAEKMYLLISKGRKGTLHILLNV